MTDPELTAAIRTVIINSSCAAGLATYLGEPAVFTRSPTPGNVGYPLIVIDRNSNPGNEDGVNDFRPLLSYTLSVFGINLSVPAAEYRTVSGIAYCIRTLFHRKRNIVLSEWGIVDQRCIGPVDQPSTDQITTRVVTLNVRIAQLAGSV